jgi:hypothetical protein
MSVWIQVIRVPKGSNGGEDKRSEDKPGENESSDHQETALHDRHN